MTWSKVKVTSAWKPLKRSRPSVPHGTNFVFVGTVDQILNWLEHCSTHAAHTYSTRNPRLSQLFSLWCHSHYAVIRYWGQAVSPIAISTAIIGSDKASYSHYDVIGDWAGHTQCYGCLIYKDVSEHFCHGGIYPASCTQFTPHTHTHTHSILRPFFWAVKWWSRALVSPDGVAPSQMVGASASVNLLLHHKVQKFSSGTGSPGWSRKKGCKRSRVCVFGTIRVSWCKGKSSGVFVAREDNRSRHTDHPDGCHSIWPNQWPSSIIPHFYGRCASCHNPPNLSWLGRGTKYAALHTQWVGYSIYTSRLQYWYNIHSLLQQQYMMLYQ